MTRPETAAIARAITIALVVPWGGAPAGSAQALTPQEAGVRYGQALGAARACYGLVATEAARELERAYAGAASETFRAEADKVAAAWQEALGCKKSGGPNECRLIFETSCRDAYREIGPDGSALPGLIDRAK